MKKILLSLSIAAIFAACSNPQTAEMQPAKPALDTAGLASYNNWKEQQAAFSMEGVNQTPVQAEEIVEEKPTPVIVYREAPAKRKAPVKQRSIAKSPAPVRNSGGGREATSRDDNTFPQDNEGSGSGAGSEVGSGSGSGSGTGTSTGDVAKAPVEKKEGWSKAAKGTAIGGASGAVIGAVLSKNKGAGAVIGGVVGAAGGYILGRKSDKKDGRY